jgi:pSer/pThr/pTyr-binding forkhead associated (FHA) protein
MIKDNEVLVLKAVEGQLLNNIYIIGKNGAALGRHSASNDIVISESFVSRRHCEIKYINLDFTKFLKSNFYLLF